MRVAAETLYLLSTFSIRSQQIQKALIYATSGVKLFPNDERLIEICAYAYLLNGQTQEAEDILSETGIQTENAQFLRSRTAILLNMPKEQRAARLRNYLAA